MDERQTERLRLRDTMGICQNRYSLPDVADQYLKLFELAKKLYESVNLTDLKYNKRFDEVMERLGELEKIAQPLIVAAATDKPDQLPKKKRGGSRPGAGRPGKGYERRKHTISLPPEYWEKFDDLVERSQTEQAALIRSMMTAIIDQVKGLDDEIACPVCAGSGAIQPKAISTEIVCPGCNGAKKLQQIKLNF